MINIIVLYQHNIEIKKINNTEFIKNNNIILEKSNDIEPR